MDTKLTCQACGERAAYRDKLSREYCYDCYWNLATSGTKPPRGDYFTDSDYYRTCPYCKSGDLCNTTSCIAKCERCGIVDQMSRGKIGGSLYCSKCINIVGEEQKEKNSEARQKKADNIAKQVGRVLEIEPGELTVKDYREVKDLQEQLEILIAESNKEADFNPGIILKKSALEELEKNFPEQIKKKANRKKDESEDFLRELRMKLINDIFSICRQKQLSAFELEADCPSYAVLRRGCDKILSQKWLLDTYQKVKVKLGVSDDSPVNSNTNTPVRERERKGQRSQLQSEISTLESNPNKTPEQEQELAEKKRKLQKLEVKLRELEEKNKTDNSTGNKSEDKTMLYAGGGIVGVLGIRKKENEKNQPNLETSENITENENMVTPRNVLIIGITGHGKSTLANVLAGEEICKESAGGSSETRSCKISNFKSGFSEEVILYEIGKSIYAAKEGIDQVFFVFRGRFSQEQIKNFKLFEKLILESGITKFTTLVRSNFEDFRNSQECENDRQALLKESAVIREIIESCNGILHVDNPAVPEIDEDDSDNEEEILISKEKRKESRNKVLKHLEEKQEEGLIKKEELEEAKKKAIDEIKFRLEKELPAISRGKSTLANVITNTNDFKEGKSGISETKEIQTKEFKNDDFDYLIIDNPGIGDTKLPTEKILDTIAEAVYLVRNGVSRVFFVTDGRFDKNEMATYNLLRAVIFDQDVTKNTTIIRTRFKDFKKPAKREEDIESMIKEGDHLSENCQANSYKPPKLQELSDEIIKFMEGKKKLEEDLKSISKKKIRKLRNKKINDSRVKDKYAKDSTENISKKNEVTAKQEKEQVDNSQDSTSKNKRDNNNTEEEIKNLEEERKKLKEEIEEKENIIRQRVFAHIFNNYGDIEKVLGSDTFISSVIGDDKND
ncbi:7718_t:CDS:2 [Cetraspora pellucida]|uniref:7718_t:CDS:1 n=1 Tax=Cetraspora pellucida TaxID=1433469 RepID=A0ACA9K309_9GLOM|nr:7718_t:CDS:2 [Cetraspora pellucida]